MIRRLRLAQPRAAKPVVELAIFGPIGRWFRRKEWGASTIPLPWVIVIMYWTTTKMEPVNPAVRVHEFVHVRQTSASFFLLAWCRYLKESAALLWAGKGLKNAYQWNPYEIEAYTYVDEMKELPPWARVYG